MATKKTKITAPSATQLDAIGNAAFHGSSAHAQAVALIRAAGYAQKDYQPAIRGAFIVGYCAGVWFKGDNLTRDAHDKAAKIVALPGATGKAANRRTTAQEATYAAARMAFSRVLKDAGFATVQKKGGARQKAAKPTESDKPADTAKPAAPTMLPRANGPADVHAWLTELASTVTRYFKANAKVATLDQRRFAEKLAERVKAFREDGTLPDVLALPAPDKGKGELASLPAAPTVNVASVVAQGNA